MEDCIFCNIVSGKADAAKVYEDDDVLAFLDIFPESNGHALVIPKKHVENVYGIDDALLAKVTVTGKHLGMQLKEKLGADGILLKQANGKEAGQVIFHLHLHVIPKYAGNPAHERPTMEQLKSLAERLK